MRFSFVFALLIIVLVVFSSCNRKEPAPYPQPVSSTLKLVWYQSFETETKEDAEKGLLWTLSFLGAALEDESAYRWNGDTLIVDAEKIGIADRGQEAMYSLFSIIRNADEYQEKGAFDMGRFVALTLLSSNHYYKITGVPETLEEWMAQVPENEHLFAITASTVSIADRLIAMNDSTNKSISDHFISYEGFLDSSGQSFDLKEYEVFDIMPNGQMRFAVYDLDGRLKTAADSVYSLGGKPAKCLWCHEMNINPNFANAPDVFGFKSVTAFNNQVSDWQTWLDAFRQNLSSQIDLTQKVDHEYAELLYIGFMEPNAARLAQEWGMSESDAKAKLTAFETHDHEEFSFMQALYFRSQVDAFAPFSVMEVPISAREASNNEPNLL